METSDDKTKRKYLKLLTEHEWHHQYSVFYEHHSESKNLLNDMKVFKQRLIRACPDQPFLVRIQLLSRENSPQAYLTIFTTERSKELEKTHSNYWPNTNLLGRKISKEKKERLANAIGRQKPHDLLRFFQVNRVRRYSVLNEGKLVPLETKPPSS